MVHSARSLGSAALNMCNVAEGGLDAYWEGGESSCACTLSVGGSEVRGDNMLIIRAQAATHGTSLRAGAFCSRQAGWLLMEIRGRGRLM